MHILTPCTLLLLGAARRPALLRDRNRWVGGVSGDKGPCSQNSAPRSSQLHLYQDYSLAEDKSRLGWLPPNLH